MIEIKARLLRTEGGIYATGERLECLIIFKNKSIDGEEKDEKDSSTETKNPSENEESDVENLAWASMQIHCYRKTSQDLHTSNSRAQDPHSGLMTGKTSLETVTPALGDIIYASEPKILFCDMKLPIHQTKTFYCAENLPRTGPPTYRGHNIKYFYRLIIATQRVKSKVQTLIIPIRILPIPIIARPEELNITEDTNDELAPSNPFLEKQELTELEMSWHHLKNLTARRAPKFYRISNKNGCVAHFCLFKPSYKLGEDIVGSLDFSKGNISCIQFLVKLQSVEIYSQTIQNKDQGNINKNNHSSNSSRTEGERGNGVSSPSTAMLNNPIHADANSVASSLSGLDINSKGDLKTPQFPQSSNSERKTEKDGKVTTHVTSHEMCYALLKTEVVLNIPLHLTPSFRDDLVELRYRLHFEFVISESVEFQEIQHTEKDSAEMGVEIRSPNEVSVETMIWDLPINVYATNPLQIYVPPQEHHLIIK